MELFCSPTLLPGNFGERNHMKTPKIVGELEHRAGRQLTLLLGAARKQYDRFMNTAEKASA